MLFSLDDPYIHLALAEHLSFGHYGLNGSEMSAPSSSILYPFLLLPLISLGLGQISSLVICLVATMASGWLMCRILAEAGYELQRLSPIYVMILAAAFVLDTNLIGVAFTGMEHSVQIACALGCLHGLQRFLWRHRVDFHWLFCAAIGPCIRYESISLLIATAAILAYRKQLFLAFEVLAAGVVPLVSFSFFLLENGMAILPSSALAKLGGSSPITQAQTYVIYGRGLLAEAKSFVAAAALMVVSGNNRLGLWAALISLSCFFAFVLMIGVGLPILHPSGTQIEGSKLSQQITTWLNWRLVDPVLADGFPQFLVMAVLLFASVRSAWQGNGHNFEVACFGLFVILAHLALGQMGWFCRYQTYALVIGIASLAIVRAPEISRFLHTSANWRIACILAAVSAMTSPFLWATLHSAGAARNIYDQQFQMRRFVAEFYRNPVAVNDIGEVGFANAAYVLDLWGLASEQARKLRTRNHGVAWMDDLVRSHHVKLATIYSEWFSGIPSGWTHVATLSTIPPIYTIANAKVDFYAIDPKDIESLISTITAFSKTLPSEDTMSISSEP